MDLLNIDVRHAAERGTNKFRGWLEIERNIDAIELLVSGEIMLEPAHDVCLLRLGEEFPAIVDSDRHNLFLFEEEEVDDQIVPCLDELMLASLPGSSLDKLRFVVCDQANVWVLVIEVGLEWMFDFNFILLAHKVLQLDLLGHTVDQSGDLDTFTHKSRDTLSRVEEVHLASIDEVIWVESHHTPELSGSDVREVTFFEVAIQVLLAVLRDEVGFLHVAILIDRLPVFINLCEFVELYQQSLSILWSPRNVLGIPRFPLLLLRLLLLPLPVHPLATSSSYLFIIRLLSLRWFFIFRFIKCILSTDLLEEHTLGPHKLLVSLKSRL